MRLLHQAARVETHVTPIMPLKKATRLFPSLAILMLFLWVRLCQPAAGQTSNTADPRPTELLNTGLVNVGYLNAEQVVQNLVRMNLERAKALQAYESTRVYRLEYKGFPSSRKAEIVVHVKYQAPGTKQFEIVSETGSKMLIDRVFKKLLQGEKEAFEVENQKRTAINRENYEFTLIDYESGPRSIYVFSVKPRTKNKYLFQGKIWVDAEQFAIVRMQGEPAKNPSFWTKDTKIETLYVNVDDFWLPAHNHSITAVRLGGHADFSIEYKDYRITGASPLNKLSSAAEPTR
jgi:outer membrane lipoprotein-sorting protein